jgi:hypothetical protein
MDKQRKERPTSKVGRVKTRTMSDTTAAIGTSFANGKQLTYSIIEEYDGLPKCDKREYALRAVATNQTLKEAIQALSKSANDIATMHATEAKELRVELDAIKTKWWYRLFNRVGL